jgi:hypothetical protein
VCVLLYGKKQKRSKHNNMIQTSSNETMQVILTKTYNGGSSGKHLKSNTSGENRFDAFLHYSNRETRMRALLCHRDDRNEETGRHYIEPSSISAGADFRVHRRETRITFELHPSVLMDVDPI